MTTGYTRAQLAAAVDEVHGLLHEAEEHFSYDDAFWEKLRAAHKVLHRVGAGQVRTGCATPDPEVQRVVRAWIEKLEGTGLPCGHQLADLIGGPGAITKCGACLAARQKEQHGSRDEKALRVGAAGLAAGAADARDRRTGHRPGVGDLLPAGGSAAVPRPDQDHPAAACEPGPARPPRPQLKSDALWDFPEEQAPCGEPIAGQRPHLRFAPVAGHDRFTVIWEPLPTIAPRPSRTTAFCCLAQTVVFYKRGPYSQAYGRYVLAADGVTFAEWDRVQHHFHCGQRIRLCGQVAEVGPGRVVWRRDGWWMRYVAKFRRTR